MRRAFLLILLLGPLAGCGSGTAAVSGQVLLNGKPLPGAHVTFQPDSAGQLEPGPGSYGKTDEEGRYSLRVTGQDHAGAVVGRHKVRISLRQSPDKGGKAEGGRPREMLPPRYNGATTLSCDVPAAGLTDANFQLTQP